MGNQPSSSQPSTATRPKNRRRHHHESTSTDLSEALQQGLQPAAALLDRMCGPYLGGDANHPTNHRSSSRSRRHNRRHHAASYSEDDPSDEEDEEEEDEEDSRTLSEEETTVTTHDDPRNHHHRHRTHHSNSKREDETTVDSYSQPRSSFEEEEEDCTTTEGGGGDRHSHPEDDDDEDDTVPPASRRTPLEDPPPPAPRLPQPLASAFAKRCYFTKAGIGGHSQHYEGLTLSGHVILMLAAAMKLKGCPTICDEDLRRVEQTFPNQFSRLPDELLLSSGWRRISKYCHFSNKPIPDGIPFFHSKQRLHPSGGYFFLLAAAVGMVRPIDVEPLHRDTLVLLETDYPTQCDAAPAILVQDPDEWTLVDKFCFFSGGPINTDEDVYYQADFDGNPIYMLAFLSPSLTPAELYKLNDDDDEGHGALTSIAAVEEVESVYDLTERDFDDLKLYHLGPCRALPPYILQPTAWTKVLPPHFLAARETALRRAYAAQEEEEVYDPRYAAAAVAPFAYGGPAAYASPYDHHHPYGSNSNMYSPNIMMMEEDETLPLDEARYHPPQHGGGGGIDPPEDEPPSLRKHGPPVASYEEDHHSSSYQMGGYGTADYRSYPSADEAEFAPPEEDFGSSYQDTEFDLPPSPEENPRLSSGGLGNYHPMDHHPPPYENAMDYEALDARHQPHPYRGENYHPIEEEEEENDIRNHHLEEEPEDPFDAADVHIDDDVRNRNLEGPEDPFEAANYQHDVADDFRAHEERSRPYPPPLHDRPEYQNMGEYYHVVDGMGRRPGDRHPPPMEKDQGTSPTSGSEFSAPTMNDDGFSNGFLYMSTSTDVDEKEDANPPLETTRRTNTTLFPATTPRSEYSPSSAMRGAQELLRRNRQKRLEAARNNTTTAEEVISPTSQDSSSTWQTGSEGGSSSIYDATPDRTSRRALILQMARARMKNQGEEKKLEHIRELANEIDLTTTTLDLD